MLSRLSVEEYRDENYGGEHAFFTKAKEPLTRFRVTCRATAGVSGPVYGPGDIVGWLTGEYVTRGVYEREFFAVPEVWREEEGGSSPEEDGRIFPTSSSLGGSGSGTSDPAPVSAVAVKNTIRTSKTRLEASKPVVSRFSFKDVPNDDDDDPPTTLVTSPDLDEVFGPVKISKEYKLGGYLYEPGVHLFTMKCTERKLNREPLVLLLDSPFQNPLNAIPDLRADPLNIFGSADWSGEALGERANVEFIEVGGGCANVEFIEIEQECPTWYVE